MKLGAKDIDNKVVKYVYLIHKTSGQGLTVIKPQIGQISVLRPLTKSVEQMWQIDEIKPRQYELVHAASTYVLQWTKNKFLLSVGRWKASQTFRTEWVMSNKEVRFKVSDNEHYLGGGGGDENHNDTVWEVMGADDNAFLQNKVTIENARTGLVLDMPQASLKKGTAVCQWICNNRSNQLWQLVPSCSGAVFIRNLRSQLVLDIEEGKKSLNTSIIQYSPNPHSQNNNQLWKVDPVGHGLCFLRSLLDPSFMLGLRSRSKIQEAEVVLTNEEINCLWIIHNLPQLKVSYV